MLGVWERHPLLALFAGNALVLVALLPPTVYSSDGANMMRVAESLATSGDFDVPCGDQAIPGRGGRCFSTFYPLLSVVAAPFILAGRAISSPVGVPPEFGGPLVALLVSALAAAGADDDRRRRVAVRRPRPAGVFAGAAFAFDTEALTYARILRRDAGLVLHHSRAVGVMQTATTVSPFERYYTENAERGQSASERYWDLAGGPLIGVWAQPRGKSRRPQTPRRDPR